MTLQDWEYRVSSTGATGESLFVISEVYDDIREIMDAKFFDLPNVPNNNGAPAVQQSSFRQENLKFVLRILVWALQQRYITDTVLQLL